MPVAPTLPPPKPQPTTTTTHSLTLSDGSAISFVDWVDEPRHHLHFENDYVRVYIAIVPPGERTLFHRHTHETVYACLSDGGSQGKVAIKNVVVNDKGEKEQREQYSTTGQAFCLSHTVCHLVHEITPPSTNTTHMRFLGAEVKATPPCYGGPSLHARYPCYNVAAELSVVRVYKLRLGPGETTGPHRYDFSGFLTLILTEDVVLAVTTTEGISPFSIPTPDFVPGFYTWFDGPLEHSLTNKGTAVFEAVVSQWL